MEQKIKEIGARIKELREILGLSVERMAEITATSAEEYLKKELGESDFSFTFIFKCASAFGVEVTDLVSGESPTLSSHCVTRGGEGLPIHRRRGFVYNNLAPMFRSKLAEPFMVTAPFLPEQQDKAIELSTHGGQEMDIVVSGSLKIQIGEKIEILNAGDSVYYNSATPHGMIAVGGEPCQFYAIVVGGASDPVTQPIQHKSVSVQERPDDISSDFIQTTVDENGILNSISFTNEETYNFAYDTVDRLAEKCPDKLAMLWLSKNHEERRFTFSDMSRYSSKTANFFQSLGIKRGDRVMLVLKRHYQFWFSILALHKIGAIVIPATNQLVQHDFEYRFQAAGVSAIVCTGDGDVAEQVDLAEVNCPTLKTKIMACGVREGWHNFDEGVEVSSDSFPRAKDAACGTDDMLMFFTSGTTGYPKIATHSFQYPLGHYITAKYWHHVNPDGLHFTISDTGWGKALWGKLYGQWLSEAAIFTYDFDRFNADDILPMFAKYQITTFCAPPTMYRFFIKEDLSKYDLSSMEYCTVAGEALNPEVFAQWKKATGLSPMEGFGQTETTLTIGNFYGTTPIPGSMGRPSPLYQVDIVDENGKSVKDGVTGEIVVHTEQGNPCGLFKGYYRQPEKTEEIWHDGLYHTGDTAWRDENGYFWYVGRVDDVIKSSGYRIGPFEIESVIMELPYVLECAVTAAPDEIRGQVVKATIVLTKGTEGTDELKKEIQTYVKTHTAPYKYPRIVEFTEELPKTISGKIRRVELREQNK